MANTNYFHARSVSLTSSSHPLVQSLEEQLSQSFSCQNLQGLKDLYECVEEVLQLSAFQRALSQSESVEEVLDGSLRLLDVCGTTRDVFSQLKQCLQDLASSFRRRKGGETGLVSEIGAYLSSRKRLNKVIAKCLASLKKKEVKKCVVVVDEAWMLQEAEKMSLGVLESLLSFASKLPRHGGWSLVSRLVQSKSVSCERQDLEKLDSEVVGLWSKRSCKMVELQQLLEEVELSIQELEEDLECVFRRLVKTRVALLNIFNH